MRRVWPSQLIEKSLAVECGGRVRIDFRPDGVVCEIEAALAGDPT